MKNRKVLILGGGVAGCSAAYFLMKRGYKVTIIEKSDYVGGMSRTHYYAGHPYEFGPHIWFWPHEDINNVIRELTNDQLYYIERPLLSFIEKDRAFYRYPIHFADIKKMPDRSTILKQLRKSRDKNYKLIERKLPKLGKCSFEEYFMSAIGKNLYDKFMKNYTWKMWNIPGDKLKTSIVWADRIKHNYEGLNGYDPIKFEEHPLGKGIKFQIYPKKGWNVVWERMAKGAKLRLKEAVIKIEKSKGDYFIRTNRAKYYFKDYCAVISTLSIDNLWGEDSLPYTGRIILPIIFKDLAWAFRGKIESVYYPGIEFQTRVTEMKRITRHKSKDTLIIVEVPIDGCIKNTFPENVMIDKHYRRQAYPQQSKEAIKKYNYYLNKSKKIKNLFLLGRLSEFKYWGMPETVNSAYQLIKNNF